MITKWITNALKNKAKDLIGEGLDIGLEYLKNQLITTIYPTYSDMSVVIKLLEQHCEELYLIRNTIKTSYNNEGRYYELQYLGKSDIFEFDGIFKIKDTNLIFRFTTSSGKDLAFISKFSTLFTMSEDVEKQITNLCKLYEAKYFYMYFKPPNENGVNSLTVNFVTYEQYHIRSLFVDVKQYTNQIKKHLSKSNICVVLLYGQPGNQKSTYIKHLINDLLIKDKQNFENSVLVHNAIPSYLGTGIHIIEDVDRLLSMSNMFSMNIGGENILDSTQEKKNYFTNLPQFLNCLDGTGSFLSYAKKQLVIMTANDINNLPDALLNRRFDLQIRFDNPPKSKWLEILNTYLKPEYSNIVIEELNTLELSKLDNPFSVSLLLKLAKNLEFLDLEDKEIFSNTVLVEYHKLNIV